MITLIQLIKFFNSIGIGDNFETVCNEAVANNNIFGLLDVLDEHVELSESQTQSLLRVFGNGSWRSGFKVHSDNLGEVV